MMGAMKWRIWGLVDRWLVIVFVAGVFGSHIRDKKQNQGKIFKTGVNLTLFLLFVFSTLFIV
jgi:hypothetical protein